MSKNSLISKRDARRIALLASGLTKKEFFGRGINAAQRAIDRIRYVQIDTISILQRSHHHIFWSRVPNYHPAIINKLQREKKSIFEYWAHAAAYLPMSDYRFSLPLKDFFRQGKDRWPKSDPKIMSKVLKRIEDEGPLMARDFRPESQRKRTGWWDWKPAKLALERLFFQGDLMVLERRGFQKVYDLPARIIPHHIDTSFPSREELARHLIDNALQTHGLASVGEISYLRKGVKRAVQSQIEALVEDHAIKRVHVRGLEKIDFYTTEDFLNKSIRIQKTLRILSPFDPLIIQRKRLQHFFDFDYQIECYVPKEKRKYGYYVLPLLLGDQLIGRLDAKADRKKGVLQIFSLRLEDHFSLKLIDVGDWMRSLEELARFGGCDRIQIQDYHPPELAKIFPLSWSWKD